MRYTIRFFGILDVISIIIMAKTFWNVITHVNDIPHEVISQAKVVLMPPLFISLFISAAGLILFKKFGFITYYIQFPFRLVVWIFSIGFVTLLPELLGLGERWFDILFRMSFIAEFFRLYYTIKIHRKELL